MMVALLTGIQGTMEAMADLLMRHLGFDRFSGGERVCQRWELPRDQYGNKVYEDLVEEKKRRELGRESKDLGVKWRGEEWLNWVLCVCETKWTILPLNPSIRKN